ncbi:MAG TPA: hypothetical protein PLF84_21520, partial [Bryobacteraceae bacterium]|nr:hypothetical protein [Bryobacteraceae bacterium]
RLLEKEAMDGAEVKAMLEGKADTEPALPVEADDAQQVLRPETSGTPRINPGLIDGERPQPA